MGDTGGYSFQARLLVSYGQLGRHSLLSGRLQIVLELLQCIQSLPVRVYPHALRTMSHEWSTHSHNVAPLRGAGFFVPARYGFFLVGNVPLAPYNVDFPSPGLTTERCTSDRLAESSRMPKNLNFFDRTR